MLLREATLITCPRQNTFLVSPGLAARNADVVCHEAKILTKNIDEGFYQVLFG